MPKVPQFKHLVDSICRNTESVHLTIMTDCLPWLEFLCVDFEAMSSKYSPDSWMKLLAAGKANSPEKQMNVYSREFCYMPELLVPLGFKEKTDYLSWEFIWFKTKFLCIEFSLFLVSYFFYGKSNLIQLYEMLVKDVLELRMKHTTQGRWVSH